MQRLLLVAAAMTLLAAAPRSAGQTPSPAEQTVDILAERFSFTPSEVKVPVGTKLTIRLTSDDTDHGFSIVGENVNVQIPKRSRGAVTVSFTPQKPGRYTFECSHLCGAGHAFMRGVIVATEPAKEDR